MTWMLLLLLRARSSTQCGTWGYDLDWKKKTGPLLGAVELFFADDEPRPVPLTERSTVKKHKGFGSIDLIFFDHPLLLYYSELIRGGGCVVAFSLASIKVV